MIFTSFAMKTGATKIIPVKWYDEGRTLRMVLSQPDSKDDVARLAAIFSGDDHFESRRPEGHQVIIGHDNAELALMISSEGRDDYGFLARLFPHDLRFTLAVHFMDATTVTIGTKLAADPPAGKHGPEQYADTPAEAKERAIMLSMPDATTASPERIRAWLRLRALAVGKGAHPIGAGETATRELAELDREGAKADKKKVVKDPVNA